MEFKLGDLVMEEPIIRHAQLHPPEIGIVVEVGASGWNVSVLIGGEIRKTASFYLKLLSPGGAARPTEKQ